MKNLRNNGSLGCFLTGALVFLGLIIVLVVASVISNLILPSQTTNAEVLSELDKARLAEAINLRKVLGDAVWPGYGQADIAVILYNQEYAYLIGIPDPEPGWTKIPSNDLRGGDWEIVLGDTFQGSPYYRQKLTRVNETPEAFTVQVGDQWVASLITRDWSELSLVEPILRDFPAWLRPILPYKLFIRFMLGDSDRYISLIQHESFHAYVGQVAFPILDIAEKANITYAGKYPWESSQLKQSWKIEIDFLVKAVNSSTQTDTIELARQFLAQRDERRSKSSLIAGMIEYERLRELEEGLAKYVQVQILRNAAADPVYQPVSAISLDDEFNLYTDADKFYRLELANTKTAAGDTRFYYTGMLQALLLDRLMPGWKEQALEQGINLEKLLREAVR